MTVGKIPGKAVARSFTSPTSSAASAAPKLGARQWAAIAEIAFPGVRAETLRMGDIPIRRVADGLWWVGVHQTTPDRDTMRGVLVGKNGLPYTFDAASLDKYTEMIGNNALAGSQMGAGVDLSRAVLLRELPRQYADRPERAYVQDGRVYVKIGEDIETAWYLLGKAKV